MNDNINQTGQNWTGRAPRTLREAFPHDHRSIAGEWSRAYEEAERLGRRDDTLTALLLLLAFVAGCVVGPFLMPALPGWF